MAITRKVCGAPVVHRRRVIGSYRSEQMSASSDSASNNSDPVRRSGGAARRSAHTPWFGPGGTWGSSSRMCNECHYF
jgi:hypothetical protein